MQSAFNKNSATRSLTTRKSANSRAAAETTTRRFKGAAGGKKKMPTYPGATRSGTRVSLKSARMNISSYSSSTKKVYGSLSMLTLAQGKSAVFSFQMLVKFFYVSVFFCAMRRVVLRHRRQVELETIEKPRAALKIINSWRAHKRQLRLRYVAAAQILVPFLRQKLLCIRTTKLNAALLLQRVFRSLRERYFIHTLYNRMRYNNALHVVRQCIRMYLAKKRAAFLAFQREERELFEQRCATASLVLIRNERADLLEILHKINSKAKLKITPLVTKAMLLKETVCSTGYDCSFFYLSSLCEGERSKLLGPYTMVGGVAEGTFLELPSDAEGSVVTENSCSKYTGNKETLYASDDTLNFQTSVLHNEDDARLFVEKLFERKLPAYYILQENSKECAVEATAEKTAESVFGPLMCESATAEGEGLLRPIRPSVLLDALSENDVDFILKASVPQRQESSLEKSEVLQKLLMSSFIDLLVRTESIERKTLILELQNSYKELLQQVELFFATVHAAHAAPPLYVSLLPSIKETWIVRRAEQLFIQERVKRMKIVREYFAMPLQFLNRPLCNSEAEGRRKRLLQRVLHIKEMGKADNKKAGMNEAMPLLEGVQCNTGSTAPLALSASENLAASVVSLVTKMSRRPPSPPHRRAHNSFRSSTSFRVGGGSFWKPNKKHESSSGAVSSVEFFSPLRELLTNQVVEQNELSNPLLSHFPRPPSCRSSSNRDDFGCNMSSAAGFFQNTMLQKRSDELNGGDEELRSFYSSFVATKNNNNMYNGRESAMEAPLASAGSCQFLSSNFLSDGVDGLFPGKKRVFSGRESANYSADITEKSSSTGKGVRQLVQLVVPSTNHRRTCCSPEAANSHTGIVQGCQKPFSNVTQGLSTTLLRTYSTPMSTSLSAPVPVPAKYTLEQRLVTRREAGADYVRSVVPSLSSFATAPGCSTTGALLKPPLLPRLR